MDLEKQIIYSSVLFLMIGIAVIVAAWGFQLIGGYQPCPLCLEQRTPYYIGIPLVIFSIFITYKAWKPIFSRLLLLVVSIVMLYGAGLGVYQSGAEWGYWLGPQECGTVQDIEEDASNMITALKSAKVIDCSKASWRMLYLSFAGWNAVFSILLAIIAFWGFLARNRANSQF